MKNLIAIAFILFSAGIFQQPGISEVRELYLKAAENEAAAEKLLKLTEDADGSQPLLLGYSGAGRMMMAKHVGNPFKKYGHFNKGKEKFTSAIEADPENVELRFLRFSVQAEAPAFLGYRENLEEDKAILLREVPKVEDPQVKKMMLHYLTTSKGLSDSEKEKLNNSLF